jgi:hypothetical protein
MSLPEMRELFREQWRDFCGFYKKTLGYLLKEKQALNPLDPGIPNLTSLEL